MKIDTGGGGVAWDGSGVRGLEGEGGNGTVEVKQKS